MFNIFLKNDLEHIGDHSEGFIELLRGKSIFITGGTGFFGKWFLETFAWANIELNLNAKIVILTRNISDFRKTNPYFFKNNFFSFVEGDITNFIFPKDQIDFIVHAAAESNSELYKSNPLLMFNTILEGTHHLLDFAVDNEIKDLLFISSGAVYGKQPPDLTHIPEDYFGGPDVNNPESAYSEGKRAAEMLCALYSSNFGISIKIARCFAFVGPYLPLDKHFAIGNFINDILRNRPIVIKGDGTPMRSYLYTADLIIWLLTILVKGKNCRPYNVGSEVGISIKDLAKTISALSEKSLEVKILAKINELSNSERYIPSTNRARNELGLSQIIDTNDSIRRTLNFHLALMRNH